MFIHHLLRVTLRGGGVAWAASTARVPHTHTRCTHTLHTSSTGVACSHCTRNACTYAARKQRGHTRTARCEQTRMVCKQHARCKSTAGAARAHAACKQCMRAAHEWCMHCKNTAGTARAHCRTGPVPAVNRHRHLTCVCTAHVHRLNVQAGHAAHTACTQALHARVANTPSLQPPLHGDAHRSATSLRTHGRVGNTPALHAHRLSYTHTLPAHAGTCCLHAPARCLHTPTLPARTSARYLCTPAHAGACCLHM